MNKYIYTKTAKKFKILEEFDAQYSVVECLVNDKGEEVLDKAVTMLYKSDVFDEPVKTWAEKELEKWKNQMIEKRDQNKAEIEKLNRQLKEAKVKLKGQIDSILQFATQEDVKFAVGKLTKVLLGEYKYCVIDNNLCIKEWEVMKDQYDGTALRAVSIYFSRNQLEFRISDYSDGSGSAMPIHFFETMEEAKKYLQEAIDKKETYYLSTIKLIIKYGLKYDGKKADKAIENESIGYSQRSLGIEKTKNNLFDKKVELSQLKRKLKDGNRI